MEAKILAIANQKGGVGKTTTALTLGAALALMGKSVMVMDLDPHTSASVHMRYYPDAGLPTAYDLFCADPDTWPDLWPTLIQHRDDQYFDFVPGSTRLAELESEMKERRGKGMLLSVALRQVRPKYEFIVLDCPPQMGIIMANALVSSDLLIIPIQTDFLALHGLLLLFETVRTLNKALARPIRYRAFATMHDKRAKACARVLETLHEKLPTSMFHAVVNMDTRFREASALGKVIYDVDPQSKGALAYAALAEEVVALW